MSSLEQNCWPVDNLCEVIEEDVIEMSSQKRECEALVQQQLPLVSDSDSTAGTEGTPAGTIPRQLTASMSSKDLGLGKQ